MNTTAIADRTTGSARSGRFTPRLTRRSRAMLILGMAAFVVPASMGVASAQTTTTTTSTTSSATAATTSSTSTTAATTTTASTTPLVTAVAAPLDANGFILDVTEPAIASSVPAGTAWDVISADPQFSDFVQVVKAAGMQSAFSASGSFTFVIPGNDAFQVLPADELATLTDPSNNGAAKALVATVITTGAHSLADFTRGLSSTSTPVTSCYTTPAYVDASGTVVPAQQFCSTIDTSLTQTQSPVTLLQTSGGGTLNVVATPVAVPYAATQYLVNIGDAKVEIGDINVSNGVIQAVDTVFGS